MSSSSPSSSSSFSPPDHHHHHQTLVHSSDQLCCVHCSFCDTVLAVSVPSSSIFKTVMVRCGHCTNLLSVNMRGVLHSPQPSSDHHHHNHPLIHLQPSSLLEEIARSGAQHPSLNNMNMKMMNSINDQVSGEQQRWQHQIPTMVQIQHQKRVDETFSKHHSNLLAVNRPPEKRQRVPSAYNRFIKEEIQRIKAGNPDISHREAFSAAAKNWAHFPHIHFGLMPEDQQHQPQPVAKKPNLFPCQPLKDQANEVLSSNGLLAEVNLGVSP